LRMALCLMAFPASINAAEDTNLPNYQQQNFQFPAEAEQILASDLNNDGFKDLILVIDKDIRVYFQSNNKFNFDSGYTTLKLPGESVGWDIGTGYDDSDGQSLIALVDGTDVLSWSIENQQFSEATLIKANLNGFLSKGVNRLHFSRDVNGDKLKDLIIPGAGVLNLYISNTDGSYQLGISILSDVSLRTSLNPRRLERRAGQSMRIPLMDLRDVNSDGFDDLISQTDEKLDVFIANGTAENYFPQTPSYSLDIAAIEERLGEFDIDNLDFSNLTGVLALTHEEILDDVNADGIEDLLLREAGKVSLFGGTADGMNMEQPWQVLRSGGNVLSTFLFDENDDGLKDLWLWRVETVSVGDIFLWLALSGNISVEAFIYLNDGERFERRPNRKITVNLKFPSVIRLATSVMDIANEARELENTESIPTTAADLDADYDNQDLLVLLNNNLEIFLNSIEPEADTDLFLGALGYTRERNEYELDIREIIDNVSVSGNPELARLGDRQADINIELNEQVIDGDIIPLRLNGDGLDDVFIFTEHTSSHIKGILLLSI
ncbi:MAG TPA: hypothetical protein QGI39_06005, partial [Gammaproteobacteria bacterium]|nr:hypothetical protein [Gammaproteobacteria bacterium]